jgi:hypothetical protein
MKAFPFVPFLAALIGFCNTGATAQRLPWKHGDKPPRLAGFALYEKASAAKARLGDGVTVDTLGSGRDAAIVYSSTRKGVSLVTSRLDGVAIIYATRRDAGMLDSVRVGDSRDRVLARWGQPSRADGPNALWVVDDWVIVIELGENNRVVRLGVGRQG